MLRLQRLKRLPHLRQPRGVVVVARGRRIVGLQPVGNLIVPHRPRPQVGIHRHQPGGGVGELRHMLQGGVLLRRL